VGRSPRIARTPAEHCVASASGAARTADRLRGRALQH
jgi:hypothetical protein